MTSQIHIQVATAVVEKDGTVLALKRSNGNKHFQGYWQLPEGKIETAEPPETAVLRELQEELNWLASTCRYLGTCMAEATVDGKLVSVTRTIFVVSPQSTVKLGPEHTSFRWLDPRKHFGSMALYPGTAEVIDLYLHNVGNFL